MKIWKLVKTLSYKSAVYISVYRLRYLQETEAGSDSSVLTDLIEKTSNNSYNITGPLGRLDRSFWAIGFKETTPRLEKETNWNVEANGQC